MSATKSALAKVLKSIDDPRAVAKEIERFQRSAAALSDRYPDLLRRYANRWIAIYDEEVVASAKSLDALLRSVRRKGLSPGKTVVELMKPKRPALFL